jgi:hypothetical protein
MIVLLTNLPVSSITLAMLESACKMWKIFILKKISWRLMV